MATKYVWTVETTKLLIYEYETNEILYNVKHDGYKNRNKRQDIYKKIADAINIVQPGCTVQDVKKKINGLRSQYLTEKMKVLNSIKSGANSDDVYKPTVYWYPMLKFLDASTDADHSECNIEHEEHEDEPATFVQNDHVQQVGNDGHTSQKSQSMPSSSAFNSNSATTGQSKIKRQKVVNTDNLLMQASKTMSEMSKIAKERSSQVSGSNEDSFDTFGKFIATELRSMNAECNNAYVVRQAKRKIQEILMDTWDTVESGSILSGSGTSIKSFANSPTIIIQDASGFSDDVLASAIQYSNINDLSVTDNETGH